MKPQLRQVIIEAWRDVAEVDRNKQIKKVTELSLGTFTDQIKLSTSPPGNPPAFDQFSCPGRRELNINVDCLGGMRSLTP